MDWASSNSIILYITITLATLITLLHFLHGSPRLIASSDKRQLPPGPKGWPLFGYMLNLGSMPHIHLASLTQKYGPVIWLKLGSKNTLVIQNTKAASELFKNHDLAFADRSVPEATQSHDYSMNSLALAPYGKYWRVLRRIVTVEILVNKKLNDSTKVREKCVGDMLSWIGKEADHQVDGKGQRRGIQVIHFVFSTTFNVMGNLLYSRNLVEPDSQLASDMYKAIAEIVILGGIPNISDFFPLLRRFDLQRIRRKMDLYLGKAIEICSSYVEERLKERMEPTAVREKRKDFLEVLLDYEGDGLEEPAKLSTHNISVFMLETIFGGVETTSSTVEWGLTELLRRPEAMIKLRTELTKIVGPNKRVEERHIDSLLYLQAVIKETLRLHPPIPFLLPRCAIPANTNFLGYKIPKNTQVMVSAWAIGRDPECWEEPLSFKPERFFESDGSLKTSIDYKGQHFEMVPFGGGRRNCPGIPLAQRMLPLLLGSLIHEFEWELENGVSGETIDMRDKIGMAMLKLVPLKAIPKRIQA